MPRSSTSVKKGQVLNPHGRPKTGESLTDIARKVLETIPAGQKKKFKELLIEAMIFQALKNPDGAAATRIMQHVDGMPVQKMIVEATNTAEVLDSIDDQKSEVAKQAKKLLK